MGERRVVVTGMGAITPIGIGTRDFWRNAVAGVPGVDTLTSFDTSDFDVKIGAELCDFDVQDYLSRKTTRRMDRFTQLAVVAAEMALEDAGLRSGHKPHRTGVSLGVGIGGMETLSEQFAVLHEKGPQRISPFFIPKMIGNMAAGQVAIHLGAKGPNITLVTACASASNAIGEAYRKVQRGDADIMITGGSEAAFTPIAVAGFASMRALSRRNEQPAEASRPFDAERDGFVMGEGAGTLILESLEHAQRRGARIFAEVTGYGMTADAHHITAPSPDGDGGARSMKNALDDAGLHPQQIDYINAHGTGTVQGDIAETKAIRRVFGDHADSLAVSSTKSMIGHLLGAAGAVELIATIMATVEDCVPPTINYQHEDPACDLDYVPNEAREMEVEAALSNSFGFGGQNATLIVEGYKSDD